MTWHVVAICIRLYGDVAGRGVGGGRGGGFRGALNGGSGVRGLWGSMREHGGGMWGDLGDVVVGGWGVGGARGEGGLCGNVGAGMGSYSHEGNTTTFDTCNLLFLPPESYVF